MYVTKYNNILTEYTLHIMYTCKTIGSRHYTEHSFVVLPGHIITVQVYLSLNCLQQNKITSQLSLLYFIWCSILHSDHTVNSYTPIYMGAMSTKSSAYIKWLITEEPITHPVFALFNLFNEMIHIKQRYGEFLLGGYSYSQKHCRTWHSSNVRILFSI